MRGSIGHTTETVGTGLHPRGTTPPEEKDGDSNLRHRSNWKKEIPENQKWDEDQKEPKNVRNPFKDCNDKGPDPLKANVAPPP